MKRNRIVTAGKVGLAVSVCVFVLATGLFLARPKEMILISSIIWGWAAAVVLFTLALILVIIGTIQFGPHRDVARCDVCDNCRRGEYVTFHFGRVLSATTVEKYSWPTITRTTTAKYEVLGHETGFVCRLCVVRAFLWRIVVWPLLWGLLLYWSIRQPHLILTIVTIASALLPIFGLLQVLAYLFGGKDMVEDLVISRRKTYLNEQWATTPKTRLVFWTSAGFRWLCKNQAKLQKWTK